MNKELATAKEIIGIALKKAKIKIQEDGFCPRSDKGNVKIDVFIDYLTQQGFERVNNTINEYSFDYVKEDVIVDYSARTGIGYQGIYIEYIPEVEMTTKRVANKNW